MRSVPLRAALEERFGPIASTQRVDGGDAHAAVRVTLSEGGEIFVKHGGAASAELFEAEARGLGWIGAHGGQLVVPDVLSILGAPPALCLSFVVLGTPSATTEAALGRGLAALHAAPVHRDVAAGGFGRLDRHYLAGLAFEARREERWATYFGEALLLRLAEHASLRSEDEDGAVRRGVERLLPRLGSLVSSASPSLLHGDLWSGNVLVDVEGRPVLVDPFAYAGDREVDLAMMRFFGGFSARTFAAYEEALPLRAGHAERGALYELVPLLSHAALFGGSYRSRALRTLARFAGR